MGLVSLPILNRLGFSNNWNINISTKFLENNFFFFFYLLNQFFSYFFIDFFFSLFRKTYKKKNFFLFFFRNNVIIGQIYLLKFSKWFICYINFFNLKNNSIKIYLDRYLKVKNIFFSWKNKINIKYKYKY